MCICGHTRTQVDGNTAAILGESWLAPHFELAGDRRVHYGRWRSASPAGVSAWPDAQQAAAADADGQPTAAAALPASCCAAGGACS